MLHYSANGMNNNMPVRVLNERNWLALAYPTRE